MGIPRLRQHAEHERDAEEAPASGSGGYRAYKPRVLVVDDEPSAARQLAIALELEGLQACTAGNADDALAEIEASHATNPVDLVVVELMLPRRNGLELARELRVRHPGVRIVLTGSYHLRARQLARTDCGAIAFVPKPCDAPVVAAFVRQKLPRTITTVSEHAPPPSGPVSSSNFSPKKT